MSTMQTEPARVPRCQHLGVELGGVAACRRGFGGGSRDAARGKSRLAQVLAADDPTDGIGAAWGRQGAAAPTFCLPHPASRSRCPRRLRHLRRLGRDARDDSVEEDHRGWWPAIETFIHICATNARTEATNVTTKTI